jgi:hypothetical protein
VCTVISQGAWCSNDLYVYESMPSLVLPGDGRSGETPYVSSTGDNVSRRHEVETTSKDSEFSYP